MTRRFQIFFKKCEYIYTKNTLHEQKIYLKCLNFKYISIENFTINIYKYILKNSILTLLSISIFFNAFFKEKLKKAFFIAILYNIAE